ncbi:chemical-damaging agent resistance protein C [Planotetraspora silvatica]|uniref:Chemical-damaging agent resistance protein C n=1 Tax=Planotetraspora silvatica TaxID=234614 RepID=A0A8J3UJA0_9ACTN|nr:TerD family protein [Planotetraspora silvatica]GII46783.1 chemical-damaging agent resistance protein C [Planotetraspora silvatica]
MGVNLSKGGDALLYGPGLTRVLIGLGWQAADTTGRDVDLDASALMVGRNGRVLTDEHFVFYGKLTSPDGSVEHTGDDRTGSGAGDCEVIRVDLEGVPPRCVRIVFTVSIYEGDRHGQTFGQVRDAYIRVVDEATSAELVRYDLSEDASKETAVIFGELYRHNAEWRFRAVGEGYTTGLRGIAVSYGVDVTS